jgi:hypothetical protein
MLAGGLRRGMEPKKSTNKKEVGLFQYSSTKYFILFGKKNARNKM